MNTRELLKAFLQVPELSTVGSAQERAAFIAIRLDGRTVREAGQATGVSKSQVTNLADLFQVKLVTRMRELSRQLPTCSAEYRTLCRDLYEQLCELRFLNETGDDRFGGKVGNFDRNKVSREDWAACRGTSLKDDMDE
jgi:hypothetical protein